MNLSNLALKTPQTIIEINAGNVANVDRIRSEVEKFANDLGVEVTGNTVEFSVDEGSQIDQMVKKNGVAETEGFFKNFFKGDYPVTVSIIPPASADEKERVQATADAFKAKPEGPVGREHIASVGAAADKFLKKRGIEDSETHATDPKFEEEKTAALDIAGGNPGFGYDQVKARIEDKIGRECTEQECEDIKDALNHEADGMLGTYDMRGIEDGEGKHDDNDGKDERCDYVPCEDGEHAGYSVGNMIVGYDGEEIVTAVEEDGTIFTRELGDGGNKYEDGEHAGSSVGDMIDGYDGEEIVTAVEEDGTIFTRELGDGGNKYSPEQFNDIKPIGEDNEVTQLDPAAMETIDVMIGAAMDMEDVEYPEVKGMVEAGIGRACTDEELAYLMDELGVDPHDFELEPEDNEEVVSENKYTTSDSLLDVYATVKPIVEVVVESTTVNENGQTTHTHEYLVESAEAAIEEAYTTQYLTEQKEADSLLVPKEEARESFKERYQPKTSYQLEELRRYGL